MKLWERINIAAIIIGWIVVLTLLVSAPGPSHLNQVPELDARTVEPIPSKEVASYQNLKHDFEVLKARHEDLKDRLEDTSLFTDGILALTAIVLVVGGFASYINAGRRAKEASRQWMDEHKNELIKSAKDLENEARSALEKIKEHKETADGLMEKLQDSASRDEAPNLTEEEKETLQERAEALLDKPESQHTAEDWKTRAFFAIETNRLDLAAIYFEREATAATDNFSIAQALYNKGVALYRHNDTKGALAAYADLIQRFGNDKTSAIKLQVARALNNKGVTMGKIGDAEGELAAYTDLIERFENDETPAIREEVANALFNNGVALHENNDTEAALAAYTNVIKRFENDDKPDIKALVAKTLFNKGVALGQNKDIKGALAIYADLIKRFENEEKLEIKEQIAKALHDKGTILGKNNDTKGALAAYTDLIKRFENDDNPKIKELVVSAHVNKSDKLSLLGQFKEALQAVEEGLTLADSLEAHDRTSYTAMLTVNKGQALFGLGEFDEAERVLRDAIEQLTALGDESITNFIEESEEALDKIQKLRKQESNVDNGEDGAAPM